MPGQVREKSARARLAGEMFEFCAVVVSSFHSEISVQSPRPARATRGRPVVANKASPRNIPDTRGVEHSLTARRGSHRVLFSNDRER